MDEIKEIKYTMTKYVYHGFEYSSMMLARTAREAYENNLKEVEEVKNTILKYFDDVEYNVKKETYFAKKECVVGFKKWEIELLIEKDFLKIDFCGFFIFKNYCKTRKKLCLNIDETFEGLYNFGKPKEEL